MKILALVLGLLLPVASLVSEAGQRHDRRQGRQSARIKEGVKSGELTKGEAARLRGQQRNIRRAEKKAQADGDVSGKEAAKLERMQDRASKNIYNKKHNDKDRADGETGEAVAE